MESQSNPVTVVGRVAELLEEGRKTIDELREQNIIMRKILQMIIKDFEDKHTDYHGDVFKTCAWCGTIKEETDNWIHEDSCLVLSIQVLLKTLHQGQQLVGAS